MTPSPSVAFGMMMIGLTFWSATIQAESLVSFDDDFEPKTMRLDFFHSGDAESDRFAVDRIVADGIWAGSRTVLLDGLNLGPYQFEVVDRERGEVLYSRGFASIFGEWQSTAQARKAWGTFHESLRFPWPRKPVTVTVKRRNARQSFEPIWSVDVDPASRAVNPAAMTSSLRVFPIMENGPAATKVDFVVLGDGYTPNEMAKFRADAQRLIDRFFSVEPYASHRSDFNVRAVETPSAVSGVSRPHPGVFKRTPLSTHYSSFDSERYVLTYDNRTVRDVASTVPYDFTIILVNERTYGGGGIYGLYATLIVDNAFSDYLIIHEMGHHFAGLADEYYTSQISYELQEKVTVEPWELNITALLSPEDLKWKHLVAETTPIPTPWNKEAFDAYSVSIQDQRQALRQARAPEQELEALFQTQREREEAMIADMAYVGKVGAFEGAGYHAHGLYRSSLNCIMFSRSMTFCPVCQEAITRVIAQHTR